MNKLKTLLEDHEMFHSDFQIDNFIVVKAGQTTYGQYKQTLRELYSRYKGLKEIYIRKQLLQVDIDECWNTHSKTKFEERRIEIKLVKYKMEMEDIDITIIHTEREFKRFYTIACLLKDKIGVIDNKTRNKLDREMWLHKLKSLAAMDFITVGRLQGPTVDFIFALPLEDRKSLFDETKRGNTIVSWFENYDNPLPKYVPIKNFDLKQLLG